ncbi:hypothetical protein [Streptomyces sp. NPDC047070]|uniref:hypothetical protein n=1 Tax=Streptomyces sp. NPDC047070 TaxID=3154923 RepID=UPI00345732F7
MKVEIQPDVRNIAARLGADVPYALKAVAGQLADDPDMGRPSGLPGMLTVTVDGDMFDDCPDLSVGYLREPNRIEIRFLEALPSPEISADAPAQDQEQRRDEYPSDGVVGAAATVREVADAWGRITAWLQHHAPDSYAALRPGAGPTAIAALEGKLGLPIPVELRALWTLSAGDDGVNGWGWGCLPRSETLMTLDAAAAIYRLQMDAQADEDASNAERPEEERITVWKTSWIPVISHGTADGTSGWYLDAESGFLGRWSRYDVAPGGALDTLVSYLEETADMLEAPALATRDKPGLIGGSLVWRKRLSPALKEQWQPLTG